MPLLANVHRMNRHTIPIIQNWGDGSDRPVQSVEAHFDVTNLRHSIWVIWIAMERTHLHQQKESSRKIARVRFWMFGHRACHSLLRTGCRKILLGILLN